MAPPAAPAAHAQGHPKGLYLLFTTEMWERFSFYGMRAILVLYLTSKTNGLGWSDSEALDLLGWYAMLVYLTPVMGGWLADNFLGQRRAVLIGGAVIMLGHLLLALPGMVAFYAGLGALVIGNGFFKANISTMVGGLYPPKDARRDSAFTIFYMGINVGGFVGPLACGWLGENAGLAELLPGLFDAKNSWHHGFAAAGVGMALGLLVYLALAPRLLGNVGLAPSRRSESRARATQAPAAAPLTRQEIERIIVIFVLSFFVIVFWTAFEQAGGSMNLFTERKVDRSLFGWEVPASWFQSVNSFFILLLAPGFARAWVWLAERKRDPSIPVKMALGLLLAGLGFVLMLGASYWSSAQGRVSMSWIIGAYLLHTMGELCLSPVGLSAVTKLAPARFSSVMMGVWFLSNAAANKLAHTVGGYAEKLGEVAVFAGLVAATIVAAGVLLALTPLLKRMMHGAGEVQVMPESEPAQPAVTPTA